MYSERPRNVEGPKFAVERIDIAGNRGPCGGVWKKFKQLDATFEAISEIPPEIPGDRHLYINWYPVNNVLVTSEYERKGLVNFKNDWSLVPDGSLVSGSAHGVRRDFYEMVKAKKCTLAYEGACQLVTRVHDLVKRAETAGKIILYIGKNGHPETMGVLSEVQPENIILIKEEDDVYAIKVPDDKPKIVYSQTTLSTNEVRNQYRALKERFGDNIEIPSRWDVCYATDTRQAAVEELVKKSQLLVIVGSGISHNSTELMMIGQKAARQVPSYLIDTPDQVDPLWFTKDVKGVTVSSGASVPDYLMYPVVKRIKAFNPQAEVVHADQVVEEDLDRVFKYDAQTIRAVVRRHFGLDS